MMKDEFSHRKRVTRFSRPRRRSDEEPVQSGLAVIPSQMIEMAQSGIPVTANNLGLSFDEGVSKLDFETPLEYTRGVDIGDMWEAQEAGKTKFKKNYRQAIDKAKAKKNDVVN